MLTQLHANFLIYTTACAVMVSKDQLNFKAIGQIDLLHIICSPYVTLKFSIF